jgi:hypothetical protein
MRSDLEKICACPDLVERVDHWKDMPDSEIEQERMMYKKWKDGIKSQMAQLAGGARMSRIKVEAKKEANTKDSRNGEASGNMKAKHRINQTGELRELQIIPRPVGKEMPVLYLENARQIVINTDHTMGHTLMESDVSYWKQPEVISILARAMVDYFANKNLGEETRRQLVEKLIDTTFDRLERNKNMKTKNKR